MKKRKNLAAKLKDPDCILTCDNCVSFKPAFMHKCYSMATVMITKSTFESLIIIVNDMIITNNYVYVSIHFWPIVF